MTGHQPSWPWGRCSGCGLPWPCQTRVAELVDEHGDGLPLTAALWQLFDQAAHAQPTAPPIVLYDRCIRQPIQYVQRLTDGADR